MKRSNLKRIDMKNRFPNSINRTARRSGVAAVEAALMLPLLVIVTFGAIDLAQYITLGQVVCNASREGARIASRNDVKSIEDVENAITQYLANSMPHLSENQLAAAACIQISTQDGDVAYFDDDDYAETSGNGHGHGHAHGHGSDSSSTSTLKSGDPISIQISFDFSSIRWLRGISYSDPSTTTVCRRD
jgi:hypothetical protein